MADSNYSKHKKIHDLVEKIKEMENDDYLKDFQATMHKVTSSFFHKHQKNGKVNMDKLPEKEFKEFLSKFYKTAKQYILKNYYKLNDDKIKELESIKNIDGTSMLDSIVSTAMGGIDEHILYNELKFKGIMDVESLLKDYAMLIPYQHHNYRQQDLLQKTITENDDVKKTKEYVSMAKKHNPKTLENVADREIIGLRDAQRYIREIARPLSQINYHPDKKDSYR